MRDFRGRFSGLAALLPPEQQRLTRFDLFAVTKDSHRACATVPPSGEFEGAPTLKALG